jgi:hypothetical protein
MHARMGLGWDTRHGVCVSTGRVSWTNEDVGFFEGVNVTPDPIWIARVAHERRSACLVPHCQLSKGGANI